MDHPHGGHGGHGGHEMGGVVSSLDSWGAVLFVGWAVVMWAAVVVVAYANRGPVRPWLFKTSVAVIGLGVVGQIGHFQEHVVQAGYWVANPYSPAWMTPWANSIVRGMGQIDPTKPALGMEILHLTGNFIFLAGLVGIVQITRRATGALKSRKWAKMGVWMQGIHGIEHIVLTLSVALGASRAIGLSTWFGAIDPGPALVTYRVWWHFVANLIGTAILAAALFYLWKEKKAVKDGYLPEPAAAADEDRALFPASDPVSDSAEQSAQVAEHVRERELVSRS
ncbi:DUF6008 family protein [Streptomyces sp. Wb2n-11]|uniref:DUF6008 family protein n=1 Tax=Streptomyces sp. Wb2n-11 TaxID=1030533 RepID=UPI002100373A|nr:DUF6008 family protein [Streptomyces sp. Wb2n-11]